MGRWAYAVLVLSMLLWTGLTAGAGWYAWHGSGGAAAEGAASYGTIDVAAPGRVREMRQLTDEEAALIDAGRQPSEEEMDVPRARSSGAPRPPPKYVESAGVEPRIRPADSDAPRRAPGAQSRKPVVVLDPGHGRGDPGAVHHIDDTWRWDVTEAESNLLNARLIRTELEAMGYEVYLTREDAGRGPGGPLPRQFIVSDLFWRVQLAAAVDADVYLALHGNGATVKSIRGPETWYCGKHHEGDWNRRLAQLAQQAMMEALAEYGYEPPDRGIKEDAESHHSGDFCQFVVTREAAVPAALIEFLFLTNDQDAAVLADPRSHEILAQHMARAIDAFWRERTAAGFE